LFAANAQFDACVFEKFGTLGKRENIADMTAVKRNALTILESDLARTLLLTAHLRNERTKSNRVTSGAGHLLRNGKLDVCLERTNVL